jgi:molecular chaperone DnaK
MEAGTGGDRWLGGDDLDRKLQAVVLEKFHRTTKSAI